jgi:hypothetical protein
MMSVLIYVEGQTEETFVNKILAPHFENRLYLKPVIAKTKRTKAGRTFKGGIVSYTKVRRDILGLLGDTSAALVTTMIDYYGLPDDFPGRRDLRPGTPYQRVTCLEKAFAEDIGDSRFRPFLVLHEFEALVLSQPLRLEEVLPQYQGQVHKLIQDIRGRAPEEIDEGPETHPAARIVRYFPGYQKRLHGPMVVERIGLDAIRSKCPHFDEWLSLLDSL